MKETRKCQQMREERKDFVRYLRGRILDIGAGDDVLPGAEPYDREQGDAQYLSQLKEMSFDCVYSSHCLEHLFSVNTALLNWYRVLKPGGYLYVVVPDYSLYEKHQWPSKFNGDHKQSFSLHLTREQVGRSNHWHFSRDLCPVLQMLELELISVQLEDQSFDYNRGMEDQTLKSALSQICFVARRI